ncbi:hypothetical protein L596_021445 [Steinernema carpocapsae]|uniref:Uncharacterized protein n=1 Tax=Steinernema carpocapsae TaxID=34508 RepID=A0A4U5MIT2_STECR|nr:hypothetical protein L596_021445 [Steinernema carpocapsae]
MKLLLLALAGLMAVTAFSCKDQHNNDVDWWLVYKMPKIKDGKIAGIENGHAFYYLDSKNPTFEASDIDLNSKSQAIAFTLQQYYNQKNDLSIFHAMYNDADVDDIVLEDELYANLTDLTSAKFGHTKETSILCVTFFNQTDGIWFIHSVPKFPHSDFYEYPASGTIYGQSMLCLSLKYDQLHKIGKQLYFNRPNFYSSQLPLKMSQDNPELAKAIAGMYQTGIPSSSVVDLVTKRGTKFRSFAKTAKFGKDLYDSLVAPDLKTPLKVETWRRGSPVPLDCSASYLVLDALEIKVGTTPQFKFTQDHSKMAVSASKKRPYTCIGDINRMISQFKRGGGTVCLRNFNVWQAYSTLIEQTNSCG